MDIIGLVLSSGTDRTSATYRDIPQRDNIESQPLQFLHMIGHKQRVYGTILYEIGYHFIHFIAYSVVLVVFEFEANQAYDR